VTQDAQICPSPAWDQSFGTAGTVVAPDTATYVLPSDAVIQSDGSFVVVGRSAFAPHRFVLARYLVDGSFDATFGSGGFADHALGSGTGNGAEPFAIALGPEGRIVVAGWIDGPAVARFNANGALDPAFTGGFVHVPAAEFVASDALGMVVAGIDPSGDPGEVVVARVKHDGVVDPGFGTSGITRDNVGNGAPIALTAFVLAPDGRVLVAGRSPTTGAVFLRRYAAMGGVEGGFPTASFTPDVSIDAIHVLPSGRILLALSRIASDPMPATYVGVAALAADGSLDSTFGQAGYAWSKPLRDTGATDLVVDSRARITVTGTNYGDPHFFATRFAADGTPDTCFGDGGVGYGAAGESVGSVVDANDQITLAGFQYADPINTRLVVARVGP
jgi:uncharacterized delta-60 repeat protein